MTDTDKGIAAQIADECARLKVEKGQIASDFQRILNENTDLKKEIQQFNTRLDVMTISLKNTRRNRSKDKSMV